MRIFIYFFGLFFCCLCSNAYAQVNTQQIKGNGFLKVVFRNLANNKPLVLSDSSYKNSFGEIFTVTKFKYYISNTTLFAGKKTTAVKNDYHLIDQAIDSSLSFTLSLPGETFDSLRFLLGVDSVMNTSGAQTGALDPVNDMFWTWNSGYVMEKLEGNSPQSNIVNNKIEYHIGGFHTPYSVLNHLNFYFPKDKPLVILTGKTTTLVIDVNLDKFWNSENEIKIATIPICSQPGILATKIGTNFSKLFSVSQIIDEK